MAHVFLSPIFFALYQCTVTPAAEPFDVIVGGNTFEGVAANYAQFRLFILCVAARSNYVSKTGFPFIVAGAYASRFFFGYKFRAAFSAAYRTQLAMANQFVHRGSRRG